MVHFLDLDIVIPLLRRLFYFIQHSVAYFDVIALLGLSIQCFEFIHLLGTIWVENLRAYFIGVLGCLCINRLFLTNCFLYNPIFAATMAIKVML